MSESVDFRLNQKLYLRSRPFSILFPFLTYYHFSNGNFVIATLLFFVSYLFIKVALKGLFASKKNWIGAILDQSRIVDSSSIFEDDALLWSEIEKIQIYHNGLGRVLAFIPKDQKKYLKTLPLKMKFFWTFLGWTNPVKRPHMSINEGALQNHEFSRLVDYLKLQKGFNF